MKDSPATLASPPVEALDLSILYDEVGFQVHITRRALAMAHRAHKKSAQQQKPTGYFSTLALIGVNPGTTPHAIASALFLDTPNLTKILNLMDADGLINRKVDRLDRRRNTLTLTSAGHQNLEAVLAQGVPNSDLIQQGLTTAESAQLCNLLRKVQISCRTRKDR